MRLELRWYSVKEALPAEDQKCLVFDTKHVIYPSQFTYKPWPCESGGHDKYGFGLDEYSYGFIGEITHWFPYPDDPA